MANPDDRPNGVAAAAEGGGDRIGILGHQRRVDRRPALPHGDLGRSAEVVDQINTGHTNERYLPGFELAPGLTATVDLREAVEPADILIMAVPSHGFRGALDDLAPHLRPWAPVVSLVKGLLYRAPATGMTEIVDEALPGHPAGVLAGPNIAREVVAGYAAAAVLAMPDPHLAAQLGELFRTKYFRIYSSSDVVGVFTNGRYWIEEFHFDGFRFDATHAIHDESEEYIIAAVGRAARKAAGSRSIVLVAENDLQESKMTRPQNKGGDGLDGMWNDDFHHSAIVALTGQIAGYFSDYSGKPQEFVSAAKYGFLYQGQALSWRKVLRGTPTFGIPAEAFVCFIENHDQIANTGPGDRPRFQTSPGRYRAITALLLLGSWSPLLFQGQEFGASSSFLFFADIGDTGIRDGIRKGRAELLAPFLSLTEEETFRRLPAPEDPEEFSRCKLDFSEREKNRELYKLHSDLLKLRRDDSRFRQQESAGIDGAVLGPTSFVLRYLSEGDDDRLLLVNLGERQVLNPASEPLLAPPGGFRWETLWTSDSLDYGGEGSCNRNSGRMDFASRIVRGLRPAAKGVRPSSRQMTVRP